MLDFLFLIAGLIILTVTAEITVRGAVGIAEGFGVSPMIVGLTLVAFGTDLPELFVAINGALKTLAGDDASGLIVGNAVGSSVCQIALVTGVVGLLNGNEKNQISMRLHAFRLIGALVVLALVCVDGVVSFVDGAILIAAFIVYVVLILLRRHDEAPEELEGAPTRKWWILWIMLVGGLVGVGVGAEIVLDNALKIAEAWNLGQSFVGAAIVAVGTSLPELAISIGAVIRGKPALSIGNLVGSNVFDCLIPIGAAALISRVAVERDTLVVDLPILLVSSVAFLWFLRRGARFARVQGLILVVLFVGYVVVKYQMR